MRQDGVQRWVESAELSIKGGEEFQFGDWKTEEGCQGSCWHECKNAKNIQNVQKARGLSPYLCPMPEILGAAPFLSASADDLIILDVRSPAEYAHSHIPGALSFPLFSDEERHQVGYLYKQVSQTAAMMKGLEYVGPKMSYFLERAMELSPQKEVGVYCWRGGKRSESIAWLLDQGGFKTTLLKGGYKAARRYFLNQLERPWKLIRLAGRTGSGKTRILDALKQHGEQVLDLEGMANHRGSAFGHLGLGGQPSNEYFENQIGYQLDQCLPERPIWVEDESRHIGRLTLPKPFWEQFQQAPAIFMDVPAEIRVQEILKEYGIQELRGLRDSFHRISRKMGPQLVKEAIELLDREDLEGAARLALAYYDRTYDYHLRNHTTGPVINEEVTSLDYGRIADRMIEIRQQIMT